MKSRSQSVQESLPPEGKFGVAAKPRASMRRGTITDWLGRLTFSGRNLGRLLPFGAQGKGHAFVPTAPALIELADALLSVRGEASGVAIATSLLQLYEDADIAVKKEFFVSLATRFNPDEQTLIECWDQYRAKGSVALPALARAVEPPRQELFRRLNLAPNGTAALVRMRADLLSIMTREAPSLDMVDWDLNHLLQSWFNRGFLTMRSIDWSSPASLLERIIRYEAVHDIKSWSDLRGRLDPEDRRCYAFFHPGMVDEPLIFVEVALTTDMPDSIQAVLDPDRPMLAAADATTATFYSISNCQPGLRGISFGHFLIKQVAADLKRELPNLDCFVTLSPVPGLMNWLDKAMTDPVDRARLEPLRLSDQPDESDADEMRAFLLRHAANYFLEAKDASGRPRDPVARFHLGNGARLERMNWHGDVSDKGLKQSAGLMVNYLYDLSLIEKHHEAYANRGEIATGTPFRKAARAFATDEQRQDN
ncbi:malonyl-CoA decarboxylase [Sphingobium sp.]|uniref:malonyl-CoA decarboxylase n=1 Tax=Sphingobium sp. TaxID=1912891 RepID=UPI0028BDA7CA|nr:malonyl-CoA decarboxylase [Sphingobium sp.]